MVEILMGEPERVGPRHVVDVIDPAARAFWLAASRQTIIHSGIVKRAR
jgi:hypothetical protein